MDNALVDDMIAHPYETSSDSSFLGKSPLPPGARRVHAGLRFFHPSLPSSRGARSLARRRRGFRFYFVGDKLIMHNKAFYKYIPEDSNAQCKSYESKYASAKGEKASAKAESKGAAGAKAEAKGAKSSGGAGAKAQAKGGGDDELWSKESDYF